MRVFLVIHLLSIPQNSFVHLIFIFTFLPEVVWKNSKTKNGPKQGTFSYTWQPLAASKNSFLSILSVETLPRLLIFIIWLVIRPNHKVFVFISCESAETSLRKFGEDKRDACVCESFPPLLAPIALLFPVRWEIRYQAQESG